MKAQAKRTFKSYCQFCHQKKNMKRVDRFCMKFSLTSNTNVQQLLQPSTLKAMPTHCCYLFFKEYLNHRVMINKVVNKQFRFPNLSFRINLKDTSSHISIDMLGFYLLPEFQLCIPPMVGKIFKWMVFRLPENPFESQKIESRQFIQAPSKNSPPWGRQKLVIRKLLGNF